MNIIGREQMIAIKNEITHAVLIEENLIKGAVVKLPKTYENNLIVQLA